MFSSRLPTTIAEKEKDCEEIEDLATSEPDERAHSPLSNDEDIEKMLPLPGMPTKNDTLQTINQFNQPPPSAVPVSILIYKSH